VRKASCTLAAVTDHLDQAGRSLAATDETVLATAWKARL
jgi:hypothetical protein